VLQDVHDPLTQGGTESIENQVGVGLTHRVWSNFQVMAHYGVYYPQVESRSQWEVAYYYSIWLTPMFMHDHEV
jgi:hypothetical protein